MSSADTSGKLKRALLRRLACHRVFPISALEAVVETRRPLDAVERAAVEAAREKGATWEDIAEALGVSRQAIYQKYRQRNGNLAAARDSAAAG